MKQFLLRFFASARLLLHTKHTEPVERVVNARLHAVHHNTRRLSMRSNATKYHQVAIKSNHAYFIFTPMERSFKFVKKPELTL